MREHAEAWLRQALGDQAHFREGQWEAIEAVVVGRKRVLVVQKTGWGKSLVYFLATRLIRDQGGGPTVLVSPLLALMRNQIQAAQALGLRAETLNSTNCDDHALIERDLLAGEIDLVLISPERLGNEHFRANVWQALHRQIGLLVIDEVHCISDWGHDFRPNYRRITPLLNDLPGVPVLGTTATANDRVIEDVTEILGRNVEVLRGPLTRESLSLFTDREPLPAAWRLAHLAHLLQRIPGSGIIYCLTTRDCLLVSNWLNEQGFHTKPYYSNVEQETGEQRPDLEDALLRNEVKALVASVALGMGFDKADLSFVIHYQLPNSIVSYYQQIGRAGRGIDQAWVYLMRGLEDRDIHEYFITSAFPQAQTIQLVLNMLSVDGPQRYTELLRRVNVGRSALDKILLHLELEGAITKGTKDRIKRVGNQTPDFARWERVTAQRRAELAGIERYTAHTGCLMQFLSDALNDHQLTRPCGKCMNCQNWRDQFAPTAEILEQAQRFLLGGKPITLDPRRKWMGEVPFSTTSEMGHYNEKGLALSFYGGEGWGKLVRDGKYQDGVFSDELIEASATLIEREWCDLLHQRPWITFVPSTRHPRLVPEFAARLAQRLALHCIDTVRCVATVPEQKTMQNSYQQLANIQQAFEVRPFSQHGPVILVDDMIDSGWTMTVIGWLLRQQGAPAVYPFALAKAAPSD